VKVIIRFYKSLLFLPAFIIIRRQHIDILGLIANVNRFGFSAFGAGVLFFVFIEIEIYGWPLVPAKEDADTFFKFHFQ
jgi:hypothetical protein